MAKKICSNCMYCKKNYDVLFCEKTLKIIKANSTCNDFTGKSKYKNIKVKDIDGISFDSKKELARYNELKILLTVGEITELERQKKFEVCPKTKTERASFYVADFVYKNKKGENIIEDVKSKITKKNPVYILKRKLVKYLYPDYIFIEK